MKNMVKRISSDVSVLFCVEQWHFTTQRFFCTGRKHDFFCSSFLLLSSCFSCLLEESSEKNVRKINFLSFHFFPVVSGIWERKFWQIIREGGFGEGKKQKKEKEGKKDENFNYFYFFKRQIICLLRKK